jgi:uncharacterized phage-associated protein
VEAVLTRTQDVANFFLRAVDADAGDSMTNLRLQKLLYFAQAWHLANFDSPLFEDDFQAWVHGPVIPRIYQKYKHCGFHPIPGPFPTPRLDAQTAELLAEVWDVYGSYSPTGLEDLTHRDQPWLDARAGHPPGEPCRNVISEAAIQSYYKSLLEAA